MKRLGVVLCLVLIVVLSAAAGVNALSPYYPEADSYTTLTSASTNYDGQGLLVSLSSFPTLQATQSSYLRFDLSAVSQTIDDVALKLFVKQAPVFGFSVAVKGCTNDAWGEGTLSYSTPGDAAMACGAPLGPAVVVAPGLIEFSDPALAGFLEAQRVPGDGLATLKIEFAACTGTCGFADTAIMEDSENSQATGNEPELWLYGPNAVGITAFAGSASALPLAGGAAAAIAAAGALIWRRRSKAS